MELAGDDVEALEVPLTVEEEAEPSDDEDVVAGTELDVPDKLLAEELLADEVKADEVLTAEAVDEGPPRLAVFAASELWIAERTTEWSVDHLH